MKESDTETNSRLVVSLGLGKGFSSYLILWIQVIVQGALGVKQRHRPNNILEWIGIRERSEKRKQEGKEVNSWLPRDLSIQLNTCWAFSWGTFNERLGHMTPPECYSCIREITIYDLGPSCPTICQLLACHFCIYYGGQGREDQLYFLWNFSFKAQKEKKSIAEWSNGRKKY